MGHVGGKKECSPDIVSLAPVTITETSRNSEMRVSGFYSHVPIVSELFK